MNEREKKIMLALDYACGELQRTEIFLSTIKTALERDEYDTEDLFKRPLECIGKRVTELKDLMKEVRYVPVMDKLEMN